ncbi:hypothetical protein R1sor_016206 [Riccia sorocarpa]|uniref:Fungal lipase-type domain-containing protein n=1 Tax=Riccia sorocarpa TaxID=122646 RepID=A0ABD3HEC9_9MARC
MVLSEVGGAFRPKDENHEDTDDEKDEENTESPMSAEHWASVIHPSSQKLHFLPLSETELSDDQLPAAEQTIIAAVAASILYSVTGMSKWHFADLTLGLYKIYCRHTRERAMDTISGHRVTSNKQLQNMSHYLRWSWAAYEHTKKLVAMVLEVEEEDIIELHPVSAFGKPAYVIGLDHLKKAVVLGIRGTQSAVDVLTDLSPHGEALGDGYAHSGCLNSAKWLKETTLETLKGLLEKNDYKLVVTGHSLGAGAASLLTILLRETDENGLTALGIPPKCIKCWTYGCPPCVDKTTAMQAKYIKTVVHQDDIISRISPAALEDLRTEIVNTEWSDALREGSKRKKVVELAHLPKDILDKLEPVLHLEQGVRTAEDETWAAMVCIGDCIADTWSKAAAGEYGRVAAVITNWMMVVRNQLHVVHLKVRATFFGAIDHQLQLIDADRHNATITASNMAAEAVLTAKERKALLEQNRLYAPGILYHVIRRPLTDDEKPPKDYPHEKKEKNPSDPDPTYRCLVIRGNDPSSRFKRVILSHTFIDDHMLASIQKSLNNYDKWRPKNLTGPSFRTNGIYNFLV